MNFDNEVLAYLSTRKVELMEQHDEYISEHQEIREVLNDFLSSVLLHKPVSFHCQFRELNNTAKNAIHLTSRYRSLMNT